MTLIERYIYAVSSKLPDDIRKDVEMELEANIMDMLPENPDENQIRGVLESLGDPEKLALEYNPSKKYLIGPAVYDKYISVLKLVITIVAISFSVIIGLKWIFNTGNVIDDNFVAVFINFFTEVCYSIVQGGLEAAFWVTLIFLLIDRNKGFNGKYGEVQKKWSIEKLPSKKISDKNKISRVKTIISICFTIFFTFLLYLQPSALAIIVRDGDGFQSLSIWNAERVAMYIPIIFTLALLSLGISIWKLYTEQWTKPIALSNIIMNILVCILVIAIFRDELLWSQGVQEYFQNMIIDNGMGHIQGIMRSTFIVPAVFVIISIWDSIEGFIRSTK